VRAELVTTALCGGKPTKHSGGIHSRLSDYTVSYRSPLRIGILQISISLCGQGKIHFKALTQSYTGQMHLQTHAQWVSSDEIRYGMRVIIKNILRCYAVDLVEVTFQRKFLDPSSSVLWSWQTNCTYTCVISGPLSAVNETFSLLGCCLALIGSYRRFGTAYQYYLLGFIVHSISEAQRRVFIYTIKRFLVYTLYVLEDTCF
jgi:hypothetical protein